MTVHRAHNGETCRSMEEHVELELATRDGELRPPDFITFVLRDWDAERRCIEAQDPITEAKAAADLAADVPWAPGEYVGVWGK